MRLQSSQVHPDPSGPQSFASTQRRGRGSRNDNSAPLPPLAAGPTPRDLVGQGIDHGTLEQKAATYVKAIYLRMIAHGIPFEAVRLTGDVDPGTRVPVFDRLRPPLPVRR